MGLKYEPEDHYCYDTLSLMDHILGFKLDSEEFIANEKIIDKIGIEIDRLFKVQDGHSLFSVTKDSNRTLILITKKAGSYRTYSWKIKEAIEKKIDVDVHESSYTSDLYDFIENGASHHEFRKILASACIVNTMNGFNINLAAGKLFQKFYQSSGGTQDARDEVQERYIPTSISIGKKVLAHVDKFKRDCNTTYKNFTEKYKDIPLTINITGNKLGSTDRFFAGEISNVKEIGGKRFFEVKYTNYSKFATVLTKGIKIGDSSPTARSRDLGVKQINNTYVFNTNNYRGPEGFDVDDLERIPYNLIDEGRIILAFRKDDHKWIGLISQDPKVNDKYAQLFEEEVKEIIEGEFDRSMRLNGTSIVSKDDNISMIYSSYVQDADIPLGLQLDEDEFPEDYSSFLPSRLKILKRMCDEYQYVVKKQKSIGTDITVTEKIKYNHAEGKISYNDFSIAIEDEYIKSVLNEKFRDTLVAFYRSEKTEQEILDLLIGQVFTALAARLETKQIENINIPIILNDNIHITITGKPSVRKRKTEDGSEGSILSVGRMYYLNDQRFNKNELLVVLREMTCYRNQEEADAFITNIGRLGLSVYIGITTGYEVNFNENKRDKEEEESINRIFKFKKLQGRSNYQLLLDNTSIPIKGKKLINLLYEKFIGENPANFINKIPNFIYESCESTKEYLKYKILIDSTYTKYKDNAKSFLNKKVEELGAKHVKYNNKRSRQLMDAIQVTGLSGRNYIIAYNSKDSFVFIDPEQDNDAVDTYQGGKYICMIDQSNIKSNISFDTVVSKLLALKNDSSIAHTIYNLQEEI